MQRKPRRENGAQLAFVRSLPCLICGSTYEVHAAHIRYHDRYYGKELTGAGRKPSDVWSVPLCCEHHVLGPDAQHNRGEREWWALNGIDPLVIAALLTLHFHNDDYDGAVSVCRHAREISA